MEKWVFDLVVCCFIVVFYFDCKFVIIIVIGEVDSIEFKVIGK